MRRLLAVTRRIVVEFARDKRMVATLVVAPCVTFLLFYLVLGSPAYVPRLALVDVPDGFVSHLCDEDCTLQAVDTQEAQRLLEAAEVDAVVSAGDGHVLEVRVEGADASRTAAALSAVQSALVEQQKIARDELLSQAEGFEERIDSIDLDIDDETLSRLPAGVREAVEEAESLADDIPDIEGSMPFTSIEVDYLHGSGNWSVFDYYGPVFIGLFVFMFVFITGSMSLLAERTCGTRERLLVTPVRGWQVASGYLLGFGLIALLYTATTIVFTVCVIGFPNEGPPLLIAALAASMAAVSLTLGLAVSGLAESPFQVIQLLLAFVMPQLMLSGIFDLSQAPAWLRAVASALPLGYGTEALRDVMLRGAGLEAVTAPLAIMWGFAAFFFTLACLGMRRPRAR
ncbi:ABC transporter permease [Slackia exigua]|uniref:ABC transporter permease n=1 Tax=Slackia exigua TaxID=84109 RepID=UPI0028DBF490|nr:ABC transporter permease [Slackia exigua]